MARRLDTTVGATTRPSLPETELSLIAPGTSIDQYRIVRLVGRGAMGHVYLARDTALGRRVALKLVRPDLLTSRDAVERFAMEARTTARFNHPNIVSIFGVGEYRGQPYVALEYVEGESLRDRLDGDTPSNHEACRTALAIGQALTEAHRHGILHRDLKPDNIVVGNDGRIRVLDFGLAKHVSQPEASPATDEDAPVSGVLDSGKGLKGTPAYMAPE